MPMDTYRDGHFNMPPRHVYSAVVKNTLAEPIEVEGVYQAPPDGAPEPFARVVVAPGAEHAIPQLLREQGSMTATGHIEQLIVIAGEERVHLRAPFGTWSPKKDWPFVVQRGGEGTLLVIQPQLEANA